MVNYTTEQMIAVLKMYEANNFSLRKTAKESGVSRQTIQKWANKMGVEVFSKNKIQDVVYMTDEKLMDAKKKFDTDVISAKQQMLDQIMKRIPVTNNMDELTRGIKILNELDKDVKGLGVKDGSDARTVNYIQILTDQLFNITNNEPKND